VRPSSLTRCGCVPADELDLDGATVAPGWGEGDGAIVRLEGDDVAVDVDE
jgi:hypothetical protein